MRESSDSLVVLSSPGRWRDGDNPFIKMLLESYDDTIEVVPFSWASALGRRYDVLHLHWPEFLLRGDSRLKRLASRALFAALLVRLVCVRSPSIWTVHNDEPHDATRGGAERVLLRLWSAVVTHKVFLTHAARLEAGSPPRSSVIVHGHYRPALVHRSTRAAAHPPTELLYFGQLRPYKGIEALVEAFAAAWPDERERPRLRVVGRAGRAAYGSSLAELVRTVSGVELVDAFLPDADLEATIRAADVVLLPYKKMYNSGAALLALSVERPILVPNGPTTRELRSEVGGDWVHLFEHPLDAEDLKALVVRLAAAPDAGPDLDQRDWPQIGAAYSSLFRSVSASA